MSYISAQRLVILVIILTTLVLGAVSILSIWEFIQNDDVLWKSLTTMCVTGFGGGVILACLKFLDDRERERLKR